MLLKYLLQEIAVESAVADLKSANNSLANNSISNYDNYIAGMNKSLESKMWFLKRIRPDCLVDFGCADGSLLKAVHAMYPGIKLIGYDIDPGMEKRFKENNPDVPFTSKWSEVMHEASKYKKSCVLLSSVIHEVYSYRGSNFDIPKFWKAIFGSGFHYVVIRDTIPDKIDIVAPTDFSDDVEKVKSKVDKKYLEDFEKKWGPIDSSYRLFVRFILTYRYKDNWDRESLENYMPLSYSTLLKKIPGNYKVIEGENYRFEPISVEFKKDYNIDLKVNTHLKMILSK